MNLSNPQTRESLILRLPSNTDVAAWQEFAAIYEPLIYRYARRKGLQDADARELIQDVFVSVAQAVSNWQPDSSRGKFRAWLFTIARNHLINRVRRRRPDAGSGRTTDMVALQQVANMGELDDAEDLDYRRELFRAAASFLRDSVKESTWQAFWMTCIDGVSIDTAAAKLGMTTGAIYIARSRVLHRFKELVQEWESEDA